MVREGMGSRHMWNPETGGDHIYVGFVGVGEGGYLVGRGRGATWKTASIKGTKKDVRIRTQGRIKGGCKLTLQVGFYGNLQKFRFYACLIFIMGVHLIIKVSAISLLKSNRNIF